MAKEEILDNLHWRRSDYKQRITAKHWRELLLNNDDHLIYNGHVTKLIGKNLGFGVVEVSKEEK